MISNKANAPAPNATAAPERWTTRYLPHAWPARVLAATTTALAAALLGGVPAAQAAPVTNVGCSTADLAAAISGASPGAILSLASGCTYELTSGLTISVSLSIIGNNAAMQPAQGAPVMSMLTIVPGVTVGIAQLHMNDGNGGTGGLGGAIQNKGNLSLSSDTFFVNLGVQGGAVENSTTGTLSVTNCTFGGNIALDGGAIANFGDATVVHSLFDGNSIGQGKAGTPAGGGGIYSSEGSLAVHDSTFTGNLATQSGDDGGAILSTAATELLVTGSQFSDNSADTAGGAVAIFQTDLTTVRESTFTDNTATDFGGAIANTGRFQEPALKRTPCQCLETMTLVDSNFAGNSVTDTDALGGAVYTLGLSLQVSGGAFQQNTAASGLGGALATSNTSGTVSRASFNVNSAQDGGAVFLFFSELAVTRASFGHNTADPGSGLGGALYADNSLLDLGTSVLGANSANDGGGLSDHNSTANLTSDVFSRNHATTDGGAIFNDASSTLVVHLSQIVHNFAASGGGIFNAGSITNTGNLILGNVPDNCVGC